MKDAGREVTYSLAINEDGCRSKFSHPSRGQKTEFLCLQRDLQEAAVLPNGSLLQYVSIYLTVCVWNIMAHI